MTRYVRYSVVLAALVMSSESVWAQAGQITRGGEPAQLDVRVAGDQSVRVTLKPLSFTQDFPATPVLSATRTYAAPVISVRAVTAPVARRVGNLQVTVRNQPLSVEVATAAGARVQQLTFETDGSVTFDVGGQPVLGMGEGGPQLQGQSWRTEHKIEFDRRGRFHEMRPRWQSNAYGSRNPVAMLVGTAGWGLYVATPWVQVDLQTDRGKFTVWQRPPAPTPGDTSAAARGYTAQTQGRPPALQPTNVFDVFIFNGADPAALMKDVSVIAGAPVMPPKWSLGYQQSHRELRQLNQQPATDSLLVDVVDTFRRKQIPLDAVIYLGTGFTPTGWNTRQPSFDFNPEIFKREPKVVLDDLHARNVKVITHIVPWRRERLPTLHGTIPARSGERLDSGHIQPYWQEHVNLVRTGVDAWWPDEGDWFDLFERIKRHQLYYQGPLSTTPNVRPWSLHRNGHLGVAQWGGWVWSGDTNATWKTLEGQIAVGINHSLSLGPYWGSDTGGFYTTSELTGELYARWFQFSAFNPSFRSHGRIWRLRAPWGWGLPEMGFLEGQNDPPLASEMNNPAIEPVAKKYAELRYQLIPYTYTLAREAYDTGMPLMRALWLHYPRDERARGIGDQYLWGRDMIVAPVYVKGATSRILYLPAGNWYDWWTNERQAGGQTVTRSVDLATMPIYVRAGAIIPFDPVRQYMDERVTGPTTIKVFRGANGQFTMYEDDGISQDYLSNRNARWTRLTWNDAAGSLVIEPAPPAGATNAAAPARTFRVQLLPAGTTREVQYNGTRVQVTF